jgi:hypothetical protein
MEKLDTHRFTIFAVTDNHTAGLFNGVYGRLIPQNE